MNYKEISKFNKCGIYKITNMVNNKVYIGKSVNIYRRWLNHILYSKNINYSQKIGNFNYPLYRAFRKYGINNFDFDVIEECEREILFDREFYYMNKYNSTSSKFGYNQSFEFGGKSIRKNKLTKENVEEIFELLLNNKMTIKEISIKFNISKANVYYINEGSILYNSKYKYPLRNLDRLLYNKCKYCSKTILNNINKFCDRLCYNNYSKNKGDKKDKTIKNSKNNNSKLNNCQYCNKGTNNKKFCSVDCHNKFQSENSNKPSKDELLLKINEGRNYNSICKEYGVSANTVKKWCESYNIKYSRINYPSIEEIINKSFEFNNFKDLADYFNINLYTFRWYCKKNNLPNTIKELRKIKE